MDSCPLCGERRLDDFQTCRDQARYSRCRDCGYVCRDPSQRLSRENEEKRYRLHENTPDHPGYVEWLDRFISFALEPLPREGSRILDFGSGPEPVMAEMMRRKGWEVDIEDLYFAPGRRPGPFSLITAVEVFEHLGRPSAVLKDLAGRLETGGRICLCTEFLPSNLDDFETWPYRSDATHIGFFTRDGLARAAAAVGLTEIASDGRRYAAYRLTCPPGSPVLG